MRNRIAFRMWVFSFAALVLVAGNSGAAAAQVPAAVPPVAPAAQQPVTPATTPGIPRMEFDAVIRTALEKNPTAASAATAIARAEALLESTRATTLPTVNVGVDEVTLDAARGAAGAITQPRNQFVFGASATMPILAPARWASVTQARDQVEVATLRVAEVRQQIAVAAAQAYLAVFAIRRQVEVDERALDVAHAHLDYADRRLQGGAGTRLNQLRAAQEVAADESRLENSRLSLRQAQEALGVLVAENGPVDAGAEPMFDVPADVTPVNIADTRPDLRRQSGVIRAADRVLRDSWKDWLPFATASFGPEFVAPGTAFQPSNRYSLVFSISQPIFEPAIKANRALRAVTLSQATFDRQTIEIQARSDVRLADESTKSRDRALASAQLAADRANEVLRITASAFQLGATTNLEVIDAQRSAHDAETISTIAEDALRRAKLDLLVALGTFPK